MWNSWRAPHRATIPDAVSLLGASSVYEIGCGVGANLRLLRETSPGVKTRGSDINPTYVTWAKEHGLCVEARALPLLVSRDWDVTLSCYVLAFCDADTVHQTLEMLSSPALILIEPWGDGERVQAHSGKCPRIYHAWDDVLARAGWRMMTRWPIAPVDGLTHLTIATREVA